MTQKTKLGLGAAGFILLLGAAAVAYNALGKQIEPETAIAPAEQDNEASSSAPKQKAPNFTMTGSGGNRITLSDVIARGKPVVINFWASWCPPCKSEMPEFDKMYQELGNEIQFIMLDLTDGQRETVEKAEAYVSEQGFSFPVYFDTEREGAYTYGIRSIPTTLFIDKDGYMVTGALGAINESMLRKGIELIQ